MPTYEYRCPEGHEFERFYRKISEAQAALSCPECGKTAERRLSAGAGLLFKGSGFYLTDYGKNAHRSSGGKPGGEGGTPVSKAGESKAGESKAGEPKAGEPKAGESKASESKPPEKSSGAKKSET